MKKYILLFYLRVKSAFMSLPGILAATAIFAVVVWLAGFAGTKLLYGGGSTAPLEIALVLPDDSEKYTLVAFTFLNEIDTVKAYCSFKEMDEDAAFAGLKDGNIDAAILIPDKFIEHIMNGTNTPAEIIFPKSGGTPSSPFFRELIKAGVGDLAIAQSGIYAVDDAYVRHGLKDETANAELYLNETYLSYSLNRSVYFKTETVLSTGSLTPSQFYTCTALTLLIMFSSVSCIHLLGRESRALNLAFKRKGLSRYAVVLSRTFGTSIMFFAIFCTAVAACFLISAFFDGFSGIFMPVMAGFGASDVISALIAIFTSVCIAQTILGISENIPLSVLLLFLLTIVMLFISGAFIPSLLLPELMQKIGLFMPTTWILKLWGNILSGSPVMVNIAANIAICCICTTLQTVLVKIKS